MKKVYLLIFLGFLYMRSFSQTGYQFADPTSQWVVLLNGWEFGGQPQGSTFIPYVIGDTVFNNHEYQIIYTHSGFSSFRFVRGDSLHRVWMVMPYDTTEFPLYDFGKLPGDTFNSVIDDKGLTDLLVVVDSVDSVFIGKWRKRQFVHGGTGQGWNQCANDILVEGIGSLKMYLFGPVCNVITTDDGLYNLLCYHEQGQLLYINPEYNSCVVGLANEKIINEIYVLPNPSSTSFTLQLSTPPTTQTYFNLYDALGRAVKREEIVLETTTMQRNSLPSGIYFWQLQQGNKILDRGKVVME